MAAERIVLDASVAVEWFLPSGGPGQRYAEKILERIGAGELVPAVPDLWHYELGSVLVAAKRDKRISAAKLGVSQSTLRALEFETLAVELNAAEVVDLSLRFHLQGYDVVYFELARRLEVPVATLDGGMRTACGMFHVELV
ncbi:MAG: PIN domain-containing protein [Betaproteobacteria bacterium]|nr:PIN domain-containing protein [Betaproteobacteria bacterium]